MSYQVNLVNEDGNLALVENHSEGGTYVLGGSTEASLNITYNYARVYRNINNFSITQLHGKKAKDAIQLLEYLVDHLGTDQDVDYWKPTEGNAGYAVFILLTWAKQHPEAEFEVES